MKNGKFFGCALMMAVATTQLTAIPTAQTPYQIIHLSDVSEQVIQEFSQGNMGDFMVECLGGTSLPFKLILKGEFLELGSSLSESLRLNILKTCYVRCVEKENFLFSTDLESWKGFSEFFTGELRASVKAENGEPIAGLQLELNQRK